MHEQARAQQEELHSSVRAVGTNLATLQQAQERAFAEAGSSLQV